MTIEQKTDMITWKCLNKLNEDELLELHHMIAVDGYSFTQEGWEDVYPTTEDVLEFINQSGVLNGQA